jgi:hypothetical protein
MGRELIVVSADAWCAICFVDGTCDGLDVLLAGLVVEVLDAPF